MDEEQTIILGNSAHGFEIRLNAFGIPIDCADRRPYRCYWTLLRLRDQRGNMDAIELTVRGHVLAQKPIPEDVLQQLQARASQLDRIQLSLERLCETVEVIGELEKDLKSSSRPENEKEVLEARRREARRFIEIELRVFEDKLRDAAHAPLSGAAQSDKSSNPVAEAREADLGELTEKARGKKPPQAGSVPICVGRTAKRGKAK